MKHFTKIERQFNYLSKQINKLFTFKKWSKLSLSKRQKHIRRLRQLNSRLQYFIPNSKRLKTLGAAAILISSSSFAQAQVFAPAQTNPYNLVDNGNFVTCTLVDIDGDGDMDLFQGDYDGSTHFNENIGSNNNPSFAATLTNPFGIADVGDLNNHAFVDIDNDGDMDLFIENGDNLPDLYFFENLGTASSPTFNSTPTLNPFGFVKTDFNRHPVFVDIDNDGDMDLFLGELYGNIHYYENTGTVSNPIFSTHSTNPFGLVDIGHFFTPDFVDIDGDGDMDLFSGEYSGSIKFFENTGTVSAPAFGAMQTNPFNLTNVNGFTPSPFFADIDNDGDKDLFIGIHSGNTVFFENTTASSTQIISNPFQAKVAPNPAANSITLYYDSQNNTEELNLTISNVMGIELKNYSLNLNETSITVLIDDLANGTYFYTLNTDKGQKSTGKFVLFR
jgi:hypothetical protein